MYIVHLKPDLPVAKTEINDDERGPQNSLQPSLVAIRYILDRTVFSYQRSERYSQRED